MESYKKNHGHGPQDFTGIVQAHRFGVIFLVKFHVIPLRIFRASCRKDYSHIEFWKKDHHVIVAQSQALRLERQREAA